MDVLVSLVIVEDMFVENIVVGALLLYCFDVMTSVVLVLEEMFVNCIIDVEVV